MSQHFRIRVEQDRSTEQWLVVEHTRRGWSVLHRCETSDEANSLAQEVVEANSQFGVGA